jgi:anti-sigma B factor antagonist
MTITDVVFGFGFEVDGRGESAVRVRLTGELDLAGAPGLRDCLIALAAADIVIDMTDLTFMDCSGISVLIEAHKRAIQHGRTVVLRKPQGMVARVLDLSGVDQVLTTEPSVMALATG